MHPPPLFFEGRETHLWAFSGWSRSMCGGVLGLIRTLLPFLLDSSEDYRGLPTMLGRAKLLLGAGVWDASELVRAVSTGGVCSIYDPLEPPHSSTFPHLQWLKMLCSCKVGVPESPWATLWSWEIRKACSESIWPWGCLLCSTTYLILTDTKSRGYTRGLLLSLLPPLSVFDGQWSSSPGGHFFLHWMGSSLR